VAELLGDGDPDRGVRQLEGGLERADAGGRSLAKVGPFPAVTCKLVDERVAEALRPQLGAQLGGLVLDGWLKYRELVDVAERTRGAAGSSEDVVLAEHEITSTHYPVVEVFIDGSLVTTLNFTLTVSFVLRSVIAEVAHGRLTALRGGDVLARARISLWNQELARGESRRLVVGAVVRLPGGGVELLSGAPAAGPPQAPAPLPPAPARPPVPTTVAPSTASSTGSSTGTPWWQQAGAASVEQQSEPWWKRSGGGGG
jgi:hypothetical protein